MAAPIWKDYYVTLLENATSNATGVQYRITVAGTTIFQGRAFRRPNETSIRARINDICADYLGHLFYLDQNSGLKYRATFLVQTYSGSNTWTTVDTVEFLNDWSYDRHFNPATDGLCFPIDREVDPRQLIIQSRYSGSTVSATLTFLDGSTITVVLPVNRLVPGDFNLDFNNDFAVVLEDYDGSVVLDLSDYTGLASVTIGSTTYNVVQNTCNRYALYYINAYGGWDPYLIQGKSTQHDDIAHNTRLVEYDNSQEAARGIFEYVNELQRNYTLLTRWMNDAESARVHHLLESPLVYLHDLETGDMVAVILTGEECPFKNYNNSGHKLVNYTIEARVAQMIRR
jgi:hypothetical protein